MDRIVSSYTPTVRALHHARENRDDREDLGGVALHHTVRALRDQRPDAPSRWAAFLQAGA